jgi:hypothetical protein
MTWEEIARDYNTAFDVIMAARDDDELWDSIAVALSEARNEGRCKNRVVVFYADEDPS